MKARVLENEHVAVFHGGDRRNGLLADAIGSESNLPADETCECGSDRLQRHRRHDLAARAIKVRQHNDARTLIGELDDRRSLALDAQRVRDLAVLHRNIEVRAHQQALSLHVLFVQIVKRAVGGHCGSAF